MDENRLTDEQVEEMISKLENHFHEPVLPVSRYCDAIQTWMRCIERANTDPTIWKENPEYRVGNDFYEHLQRIELAIKKSSLLGRLIYGGEKLRTKICPLHKGIWSGLEFLDPCPHKCHLTGWIYEGPADPATSK